MTRKKAQSETSAIVAELHQQAATREHAMTTNQGLVVGDDQNSLRIGARGPTLLEDFLLREKITHFDHERIPERVVHARGYGAHGFFEPYTSAKDLTSAAFLQDPKQKTPVFVRFSTVAGSAGSADTARDVRGFAVKFYTSEGNFDLVGNNIPVFFIQDAIKFPDLIHSVKPEPDRDFPQAQSAHDTFWDFVSLTPESVHMLMWVMSDRAIPRSFRMMEGFGVHTFRMIDAAGKSTFVKFHFRPKLGCASLVWDEAVKLMGADPDFHRRDLWTSIEAGDFPEWEFCVQAFDEETANSFDFDVLDATKLIPEELVPLRKLGRMVLDRNVDSFFAETEQVAFCPSHLVPGIGFSNDPLLQGRLFSYLDTQLSRLGSANFHELPINKPKCPWQNLQRGGHMRTTPEHGRIAYEPNSLDDNAPRESQERGFRSYPAQESGMAVRARSTSFADHYSQARLFWVSMTAPEQQHIADAFAFELAKVETDKIRHRVLGHLQNVTEDLATRVAKKLGMSGRTEPIDPAVEPHDSKPSPALSLYAGREEHVRGRKIGVLLADGADAAQLEALRDLAENRGAKLELIAPHVGHVKLNDGKSIAAKHAIEGGPSVLFDAVALLVPGAAAAKLIHEPAAVDFVRDAFAHGKAISACEGSFSLLKQAHVEINPELGVIGLQGDEVDTFLDAAAKHRFWNRK